MNTNTDRIVKPEDTGWRDQAISRQHRKWGWNMPCSDIDWLVVEYSSLEPRAIVEYKRVRELPAGFTLDTPQMTVLTKLAQRARLPLMIVNYLHSPDRVDWALEAVTIPFVGHPQEHGPMSEYEYVQLLASVKGQVIEDTVLSTLSRRMPEGVWTPDDYTPSEG